MPDAAKRQIAAVAGVDESTVVRAQNDADASVSEVRDSRDFGRGKARGPKVEVAQPGRGGRIARKGRYGDHMRRVVGSVALALTLLGCYAGGASTRFAGPSAPPGGPEPLLTVETQTSFGSCVLDIYYVADVIADPTSGAPSDAATGESFAWPKGFTARRAGSEVEALDAAGNVVLLTGRRYRMCPALDDTRVGFAAESSRGAWVIGRVEECMGCELGGYGWQFYLVDCTANPTHSTCLPHQQPGAPTLTPPPPPP